MSSQLPAVKDTQIELYTRADRMMESSMKCMLRWFVDQWLQRKSQACFSGTKHNVVNPFGQLFYSHALSSEYINVSNKMWGLMRIKDIPE